MADQQPSVGPPDTGPPEPPPTAGSDHEDHPGAPGHPGDERERLIADHESKHGPLPARILAEMRLGGHEAEAAGVRGAVDVGGAAKALRLEIVETQLDGPRALVGHVLGMRLLIPAEGMHGPRETPVLLYVFRDAIAIRPSDDAPMSAVPMYGLHIVMPHVAVARWAYKAGRTAHANLALEHDEQHYETSLATWTVEDFSEADDKLQVFELQRLAGAVHVYPHLGMARIAFTSEGQTVRLKSALPAPTAEVVRLGEVVAKALGAAMLSLEKPTGDHDRGDDGGDGDGDGDGADHENPAAQADEEGGGEPPGAGVTPPGA